MQEGEEERSTTSHFTSSRNILLQRSQQLMLILGANPIHQPFGDSGVGQPLSPALKNVSVFLILFQHGTEAAFETLAVPTKQSLATCQPLQRQCRAPCSALLLLPCAMRRQMVQRNYNQLLGSLPPLGFAMTEE